MASTGGEPYDVHGNAVDGNIVAMRESGRVQQREVFASERRTVP